MPPLVECSSNGLEVLWKKLAVDIHIRKVVAFRSEFFNKDKLGAIALKLSTEFIIEHC